MSIPTATAPRSATPRHGEIGQRPGAPDIDMVLAEAFTFVDMCNFCTKPRAVIQVEDGEQKLVVVQAELHPAQEGAMRHACAYIGRYFAHESRQFPAVEEPSG
jgi:hypothetical protein